MGLLGGTIAENVDKYDLTTRNSTAPRHGRPTCRLIVSPRHVPCSCLRASPCVAPWGDHFSTFMGSVAKLEATKAQPRSSDKVSFGIQSFVLERFAVFQSMASSLVKIAVILLAIIFPRGVFVFDFRLEDSSFRLHVSHRRALLTCPVTLCPLFLFG